MVSAANINVKDVESIAIFLLYLLDKRLNYKLKIMMTYELIYRPISDLYNNNNPFFGNYKCRRHHICDQTMPSLNN